MRRFYTILVLAIISISALHAEYANRWMKNFKNPFEEGNNVKAYLFNDSSVVITGVFKGTMNFAGKALEGIAGGSSYIIKYNKDGSEAWGAYIKGKSTPVEITGSGSGDIFIATECEGDLEIVSASGEKQTFTEDQNGRTNSLVLSLDKSGKYKWHYVLKCGQVDSFDPPAIIVNDLKIGENGRLYACGKFNGEVVLGDSTLKTTAVDLFGTYFFARQSGYVSEIDTETGKFGLSTMIVAEAQDGRLASAYSVYGNADGSFYLAAKVKGKASIHSTNIDLENEIDDINTGESIALINFDNKGGVKWYTNYKETFVIERKNSQYRVVCNSLDKLENGNLALTGTFEGELTFSDTKKLVAEDSIDVYIAQVSSVDGTPKKIKALGGAGVQNEVYTGVKENKVVISSSFTDDFQINVDNILTAKGDTSDVYVVEYDFDTDIFKYNVLGGDSLDLVSDLMVNDSGHVLITGNFFASDSKKANYLGKELVSTDVNNKITDTYAMVMMENSAPSATKALEDQTVKPKEKLSYTIEKGIFVDADGDTFTLSAVEKGKRTLPQWLSFDSKTNTFEGTPTVADIGELEVEITAKDEFDAEFKTSFIITVTDETSNDIVNKEETKSIVFPTISNYQFNLKNAVEAELYNITGIMVKRVKNKNTMNVSDIRPGIYLMRVKNQDDKYEVVRVVVK